MSHLSYRYLLYYYILFSFLLLLSLPVLSSVLLLQGPRKWLLAIYGAQIPEIATSGQKASLFAMTGGICGFSGVVIASTRRVRGNLFFVVSHSRSCGYWVPEIASSPKMRAPRNDRGVVLSLRACASRRGNLAFVDSKIRDGDL